MKTKKPRKKKRAPRIIETNGRTFDEIQSDVMIGIHEKGGVMCPACDGFAQVWRRYITSTTAKVLMRIDKWHENNKDKEWIHLSETKSKADMSPPGGDYGKLRFWGFLEKKIEDREDGSDRNGRWKITEIGRLFARNKIMARKYLYVYQNKLIKDPPYANLSMVRITDLLGKNFDMTTIYPDGVPE